MSHSMDDRDGATERIPEGVPLERQAPGQPDDDPPPLAWTTGASAKGWSTDEVHEATSSAATGEHPVYRPDPLTDPLPRSSGTDEPSWTQQPPTSEQGQHRPQEGEQQPEPQQPQWEQPQWDQSQWDQSQWDQSQRDQSQWVPQWDDSRPQQSHAESQPQWAQPQQQWDQQPQQTQHPEPQQQWHQPAPAALPAPQQSVQQYLQPGSDQAPQHYPAGYAAVQPVAPAAPAAPPKPEDLLVPNQSPIFAQPASWGWRGRVNRATGGLVKTKAAPAELQIRQAIHDIQRGFSRPMTVVVVQPKGGAGKTPTTICLSAAFGANRGGYVVGWDDNETRGTLAVRVSNPDDKRATVWDLLSDLAAFERYDARVGDLSHYVRSQPDAHFDALVSDDNPGNMSQIGEEEYQRLHKVLQRFYRMIVVDTGNNVRSPNWQAAVNSADLVVVVSSYQRDVGYSGSWVLDHLAQTGREELARNAVTVLTAADPTPDRVVRGQLLEHFTARTRAVIEIPYDQELAHGGPIRWTDLALPTRNAWIQAGATIANCLGEHDQRAMAARRA